LGEGQNDVPALLRRIADSIAGLGVTAWPSATVDYHRPEPQAEIAN
jgi:hypothetical protein